MSDGNSTKPFQLIHGDCLEVMKDMAVDSVDMTITSPPYTDQRTYGINFNLSGQGWVDWCIPRIVEMCRVTAGIVFFNAAGPVRDFRYQPVVEWLVADLTRKHGIVCGPAPYVFHRIGIPGSGGPHYHRRDWEPVYCFAKPESLPPRWSDNKATGHPPKWAPGGSMSHQKTGGNARVNQWGHSLDSGATVVDEGGVVRSEGKRLSHVSAKDAMGFGGRTIRTRPGKGRIEMPEGESESEKGKAVTRRKANGKRGEPAGTATSGKKNGDTQTVDGIYYPPVLANSGNKIIQTYTAADVDKIVGEANDVRQLKVGGGMMGDNICHESEAPFSEALVRFFIVSYCPPDGTVLDPFCGSGTSVSVAIQENRNAVGIDIRDGKGGLASARKRLANVTPAGLFDGRAYE